MLSASLIDKPRCLTALRREGRLGVVTCTSESSDRARATRSGQSGNSPEALAELD
jgi:hypothetical protein